MKFKEALLEPLTQDDAWAMLKQHIFADTQPSDDDIERIKVSLDVSEFDLTNMADRVCLARELQAKIDQHNRTPSEAAKKWEQCQQAEQRHNDEVAAYVDKAKAEGSRLMWATREAKSPMDEENRQIQSAKQELRQIRDEYPQLLGDLATEQEREEVKRSADREADLDALAWRCVRGVDETLDSSGNMMAKLETARTRLKHISRDGGRVVRSGKYPRTIYHIQLGDDKYLLSWGVARVIETRWQHVNERLRVTKDEGQGDIDLRELSQIEREETSK